jgi:hypothetical protein
MARHGEARRGKQTPEYNAWRHMLARCSNPRDKRYPAYGGRGIAVCRLLRAYEPFLSALGRRPSPKHSLDRIDPYGGYWCGTCAECKANGWPRNVRWATPAQQARNKRPGRTSKLTEEGVAVIKRLLDDGYRQQQIAAMMGVSQTLVSQIKFGRIWRVDSDVAHCERVPLSQATAGKAASLTAQSGRGTATA